MADDSYAASEVVSELRERDYPSDEDESPLAFDPLLHGLTPEERDTYTAIINDIIARHDNTIISSDCILEFLREKNKLALTQQRHHLHMLIIECLKTRPTPLTHARGVGTGLGVNGMASVVFNIPELLESILSYLPVADLVSARSVNKTLHRLIDSSPRLQRQLLLLPGNDLPKYYEWARNNNQTTDVVLSSSPPAVSYSRERCRMIAKLNPLLMPVGWGHEGTWDGTVFMATVDSTKIDERILNSKTWPKMYVTDPPCTRVRVVFVYSEEVGFQRQPRIQIERAVYNPAGVTFANIWDALHSKGDVTVFGDRELVREGHEEDLEVENTTLCEQIENHRRNGVTVTLNEDKSLITSISVTIPVAVVSLV